jgi:hypothetical protein
VRLGPQPQQNNFFKSVGGNTAVRKISSRISFATQSMNDESGTGTKFVFLFLVSCIVNRQI